MRKRSPVRSAVHFALRHIAIGFVLATLLLSALFWADPGGFASLIRREPSHPWPALVLWFFLGLTLSSVQLAIAIMQQGSPPDDDGPGGGTRIPVLVPVRVTATRR